MTPIATARTLLLVTAMALAGCGGDDPEPEAEPTPTSEPTTSPPATTSPSPSPTPQPPGPIAVQDDVVAEVPSPTDVAATPDGRLLVTTQEGQLRVIAGGQMVDRPALDISTRVCGDFERGLLGVAVDPEFAVNTFVYLYYTFAVAGGCPDNSPDSPVNRLSRFTLAADNTISPASERVLIDNMPSPNGNHNAGDVAFGPDDLLYVTVGDGGCDHAANSGCAGDNDGARDRHVLTGKVLRITRDGQIPDSNPFVGAGTARCNVVGHVDPGDICQETFAWGLRNPFRIAFDPTSPEPRFHINDVGQNVWEEIDEGRAGADYGWNVREGHCATGSTDDCGPPPAGMTNPLFSYPHDSGCTSISAGAFVPDGVWPPGYSGVYLFGDFVCGRLFRLAPTQDGGLERVEIARTPSIVSMDFLDAGGGTALYYTSYAGGGAVRRITVTPR